MSPPPRATCVRAPARANTSCEAAADPITPKTIAPAARCEETCRVPAANDAVSAVNTPRTLNAAAAPAAATAKGARAARGSAIRCGR